jgi:hypothetical protein
MSDPLYSFVEMVGDNHTEAWRISDRWVATLTIPAPDSTRGYHRTHGRTQIMLLTLFQQNLQIVGAHNYVTNTYATFDWHNTIISQYANSPRILAVIESFNASVDPEANIEAWYDEVWNVATAQGYGLDVWGRIVGVNRVLSISPDIFFGFEEAGTLSAAEFNQGIFFGGASSSTNYSLSDPAFLLLIYAKAAANIWDGSIIGLNAILRILFPGKIAYVVDNLDMTMTYYFDFTLTPVEVSIVANSGVLPRPCGVSANYVQV